MNSDLKFYKDIYDPLFQKGYTKNSNRAAPALEALEKWQKKSRIQFKSVLDVGCAWGKALKYWQKKQAKAVGVDVAEKAVKFCNKNGMKAHLSCSTSLPFKDNQFDLYMSTDVYEHIREEDLDKSIKEAIRVTDGYLLIRAHPGLDKRGTLHLTVWSNEKWKEFFESYDLEIIPIGEDGKWHYKNTHFMKVIK